MTQPQIDDIISSHLLSFKGRYTIGEFMQKFCLDALSIYALAGHHISALNAEYHGSVEQFREMSRYCQN